MEARTLRQLIDDCREELDDDVEPYLWPDELLTKHLNEAVEEACIRARLLVESSRADICRVPLVPGKAEYALHPSIVVIRRAVLADGHGEPLKRTTSTALDGVCRSWRTEAGPPEYLVRDQQARTIALSPIPDAATDLLLTVWRVPAADELMEQDDDEPVIDAMHHRKLLHWACARAYMKKDVERSSPEDAALQMAVFEDYFGQRPTARALQQLSIDPATGTQPNWF